MTRYGNADTSKLEVALADARGSRWKLADDECLPACTVQGIYRIAIPFISQITLKFVWKLKNLQKIKVVPNSKFYNFVLITIPKFYLDLKMQV